MKIYLATWLLEQSQGTSLSVAKKKERLLSYYHTVAKKEEFKEYIRTGRNDKR